MFLDWLKRILGIAPATPPQTENTAGAKRRAPKSPYERLDERKQTAKEEKEQIKASPTDWYKIEIPQAGEKRAVEVYNAYKFGDVLNLKALKEERLRKEAHELKILEEEIKSLLTSIERAINGRRAEEAKSNLDKTLEKIVKVRDASIRQKHQELQGRYANLIAELEREELARLAEEKRKQEEKEKRRKEAEEKARKEKEKREQEDRARREAEAQRLADEARKKEQAEQAEKQRLMALSSELKEDWQSIIQVLEENGIRYLYHFTDRSNIPLIKRYGGLLSWYYCDKHGIRIPRPGGGKISRKLDESRNLQDYVRLCFTKEHPMKYVAIDDGRITDPVNLVIDIKAACIASAKYSNKNATIKREPVNIGSTIDDLRQIHFRSVKMPTHFDLDEDERSFFQAEVMIKTFLPKEYIVNLDNC